ncbi:hypothetical protein [Evansella cellulosilytica]|uniref:Uncharacterized protein n=1 Tax=Evansella cellulosilytica (strain ATCC 21833 / DSM 2522 / FERM P-1141 / JCM 9156 / N-4) TaxID=649639 RepID=E6U114_EVAC2|nr:hypothetical protein [Evansella cellulosilytica]ADU30326.1 hypothetical protein Bcell_2064 [Evansella cellulosilytica DSM 2522]
MLNVFRIDSRLGISIPKLGKPWTDYSLKEQSQILSIWEKERAIIPEKIKEIEKIVTVKTKELLEENDVDKMNELNHVIMNYASIINDLNIWFRIEPQLTEEREEDIAT